MWFLLLLPLLSWAQTSDLDSIQDIESLLPADEVRPSRNNEAIVPETDMRPTEDVEAALSESELQPIEDIEKVLPESEVRQATFKDLPYEKTFRGYKPLDRPVSLEEIKESGTGVGHIKKGTTIIRIKDNVPFTTSKELYLRYYLHMDDLGSFHLLNKDGTSTYRTSADNVSTLQYVANLYEPPHRYEPVKHIVRREFDKKLSLTPEAAFYLGVVQSQYVRDLFNDPKADSGISNQYAFHYFTSWNLPMKVGASLHYEKSTFNLTGGGHVYYQSFSIGPQFRSKEFDFFETDWRVTGQIRVSPFARLRGEAQNGEETTFKFNSTDLMTSLDHPWKNRFGEFVIGGYYQMQWLNIKDAKDTTSVRATNKTNQSFGLFVSQVFQ